MSLWKVVRDQTESWRQNDLCVFCSVIANTWMRETKHLFGDPLSCGRVTVTCCYTKQGLTLSLTQILQEHAPEQKDLLICC